MSNWGMNTCYLFPQHELGQMQMGLMYHIWSSTQKKISDSIKKSSRYLRNDVNRAAVNQVFNYLPIVEPQHYTKGSSHLYLSKPYLVDFQPWPLLIKFMVQVEVTPILWYDSFEVRYDTLSHLFHPLTSTLEYIIVSFVIEELHWV